MGKIRMTGKGGFDVIKLMTLSRPSVAYLAYFETGMDPSTVIKCRKAVSRMGPTGDLTTVLLFEKVSVC